MPDVEKTQVLRFTSLFGVLYCLLLLYVPENLFSPLENDRILWYLEFDCQLSCFMDKHGTYTDPDRTNSKTTSWKYANTYLIFHNKNQVLWRSESSLVLKLILVVEYQCQWAYFHLWFLILLCPGQYNGNAKVNKKCTDSISTVQGSEFKKPKENKHFTILEMKAFRLEWLLLFNNFNSINSFYFWKCFCRNKENEIILIILI